MFKSIFKRTFNYVYITAYIQKQFIYYILYVFITERFTGMLLLGKFTGPKESPWGVRRGKRKKEHSHREKEEPDFREVNILE